MNNFDKIKTMDYNQITDFLLNVEYNSYDFTYSDYLLKWLQQEADN